MKKLQLIHKEHGKECMEILKTVIIEDKVLERYKIDKDTMLHELPENIVNSFLDYLSTFKQETRQILLSLIKKGEITLTCWDDDE